MDANMKSSQEQLQENLKRIIEEMTSITRKEMMACREKTEARQEEEKPTSVDRKPGVAEHQEVPKEDAVVQPVKGWKKRHRGKRQAAERLGEPKELT
jgi:hypothetical protein